MNVCVRVCVRTCVCTCDRMFTFKLNSSNHGEGRCLAPFRTAGRFVPLPGGGLGGGGGGCSEGDSSMPFSFTSARQTGSRLVVCFVGSVQSCSRFSPGKIRALSAPLCVWSCQPVALISRLQFDSVRTGCRDAGRSPPLLNCSVCFQTYWKTAHSPSVHEVLVRVK